MDLVRRLALPVMAGVVGGIFVAKNSGGIVLKIVWIVMGSLLALRMAIGRDDWRLGDNIPKSWLVDAYGAFVGFISALTASAVART